jgi:hypothetical protein
LELWIRTPLSPRVTQRVIHTSPSPNILNMKTLLGHPHNISCLGLCPKLTWLPWFLSSELFYPCCQEIPVSMFIHRSRSCCFRPNLGAAATRQQDTSPQGRARGSPFPGWNVISRTSHQIVGISNPPVPKTDTQETEKILTRQFLLVKRVQARAPSS